MVGHAQDSLDRVRVKLRAEVAPKQPFGARYLAVAEDVVGQLGRKRYPPAPRPVKECSYVHFGGDWGRCL